MNEDEQALWIDVKWNGVINSIHYWWIMITLPVQVIGIFRKLLAKLFGNQEQNSETMVTSFATPSFNSFGWPLQNHWVSFRRLQTQRNNNWCSYVSLFYYMLSWLFIITSLLCVFTGFTLDIMVFMLVAVSTNYVL